MINQGISFFNRKRLRDFINFHGRFKSKLINIQLSEMPNMAFSTSCFICHDVSSSFPPAWPFQPLFRSSALRSFFWLLAALHHIGLGGLAPLREPSPSGAAHSRRQTAKFRDCCLCPSTDLPIFPLFLSSAPPRFLLLNALSRSRSNRFQTDTFVQFTSKTRTEPGECGDTGGYKQQKGNYAERPQRQDAQAHDQL